MLDLGTSFLASVARDPQALAIVDGDVRLTYAAWLRQISALVEGFDELELEPGDHIVTVLQNRWEAATVHWACQFAGVIVTPVNWRATAGELDYLLTDAEAKKFWPIYDAYQKDLEAIDGRLAKTIAAYADAYNSGSVPDDMARQLIGDYLAIEQDEAKMERSYVSKLSDVLPGARVARYLQLETKMRAIIRYQLAANIPLVQ